MRFKKEVVDLCQLVVISQGEVEVGWQSDVVGVNTGKWLHRSHPWHLLYLGDRDILLFLRQDCLDFILVRLNVDNEVVFVV